MQGRAGTSSTVLRGPCDKAGRVLERVCGVPGEGSCHGLKAVLVPGVAQLLSFTRATAVPDAGRGTGAQSYRESAFPGCCCVTVLIAATGDDVSFRYWRVGVRRRRRGMLG